MLVIFGEIMNYEGGQSAARQRVDAILMDLRKSGEKFGRTYKPRQFTKKELNMMAEPYHVIIADERRKREFIRRARENGVILGD